MYKNTSLLRINTNNLLFEYITNYKNVSNYGKSSKIK